RLRRLVFVRLQPAARHAGREPARRDPPGREARPPASTAGGDPGQCGPHQRRHGRDAPARAGGGPVAARCGRACRAHRQQPRRQLRRVPVTGGQHGGRRDRRRPGAHAARHRDLTRPSVLLLAIALAGTGAVAQAQPGRPAQAVPSVPAQPGPADDASAATGPSLLALRELLQQARTHLQRGDPQAAYALLEPHTADYSNAEDFNYLLGIAALDSGRPSQAVLALERVLAHAPDHTLARAEIARAFLALRETEAAKREFEAVARADLPPEVQDTIRRYLEIVASTDRPQRRWRASVEAAIGHDDNVNFGSSLDEWVLGDGLALIPTDASRPQESAFHELSGQLHYTAPIDGQTEWTIGSQLSQRSNASQ